MVFLIKKVEVRN